MLAVQLELSIAHKLTLKDARSHAQCLSGRRVHRLATSPCDLQIQRHIHATIYKNGRFFRCAAARIFSLMTHFSRCERAQHEIAMSAMGSKLPCGDAATCLQRDRAQPRLPEDGCQPKTAMRNYCEVERCRCIQFVSTSREQTFKQL